MGIHTWFYDVETEITELHDLFRAKKEVVLHNMSETLRYCDEQKIVLNEKQLEALNAFWIKNGKNGLISLS